uniref:Uncharacterized protein n=1 Tax=Oryza rufipogon TaxID=4529 RepID=A0A0E0PZE2_ORYRU
MAAALRGAVDWPRWRLGGAAQRRQQRQPRLRAAAALARNVKAVALVRRSSSAAEAAANLVARAGGELSGVGALAVEQHLQHAGGHGMPP